MFQAVVVDCHLWKLIKVVRRLDADSKKQKSELRMS